MAKPVFYFSDGPYLQVLQGLVRALTVPESLVKLLGKPRTGKSLLCEKLAYFMRHKGYRVVYFHYAIESPDMLRTVLARELDLPVASNFSRMIEEIPATPDGKPVILIFDNAHLLTDVTLLEIYRIAQIQSGATRVLNVVLCGESALEQKLLSRKELNSLRMQMSHTFVLKAMTPEVLGQFLLAYLGKVGLPGLQLDAAALRYVYKCSQGYPEQTLELCKLIVAARQGSVELSIMTKPELVGLVRQAQDNGSEHRLPGSQFRETNPWVILGPLAAVIIIASLALIYETLADEEVTGNPVTQEAVASETIASRFADAESAPPVVSSGITLPEALVAAAAAPELSEIVEEEEAVISDSELVLVTAAERGIADAAISEPLFESVQDTAEVAEAVTVDIASASPMLAAGPLVASEETVAVVVTAGSVRSDSFEAATVADSTVALPSIPVAVPVAEFSASPAVAFTETPAIAFTETQSAALAPIDVSTVMPTAVLVSNSVELGTESSQATEITEASPDSTSISTAVEAVVRAWLVSWEGQDLEAYFAAYHSAFVPRYHSSRQRWQQDRDRVISNAGRISLTMTDYRVISRDAGQAEVQFWLAYRSPRYSDDTLKKLVLSRRDDKWLILEEVNLEVRG